MGGTLNSGGIYGFGADLNKLSMYTVADPATNAATTATIIGAYAGALITTTTTGNSQTLASPTDTTAGKVFTVVNNDTSTNTIPVVANSVTYTIAIGSGQSFIWDATKWMPTSIGIISIPVPVTQGGTGLASMTDNAIYKGNATSAIDVSSLTDDGTTLTTTDNLVVGSSTAGKNETINATLGSDLITWNESAWNEDDVTWTMTGTGALVHVTGNTTPITGTITGALSNNVTYQVTITGTGGGATATYTMGGKTGTTIPASGAFTIVDYITATVDSEFIITPSNTCTVSITSVTVKALTDATGDLTIDGNLIVRSPATIWGGLSLGTSPWTIKQIRDATYGTNNLNVNNGTYSVGLQIGSDGTLSIRNAAGDAFGNLSVHGVNAYSSLSILSDTASTSLLSLGTSYDVKLYRDAAANILALRNTTAQQTFRLYNTADAAGTFTNYERVAITGVQGASVNITAETAGTGGDNLDVVITPAGTGAVKTGTAEVIDTHYDTIFIPASAMTSTATNGAVISTEEYATNDINMDYLLFDGTTEQYAEFQIPMPENWDRSTIKAKFFWTSNTGSTTNDTVEWEISCGALSDSDAIDAALGTAQVISDALLADNGTDLQVSGATPAITIGGTPALGDLVHFKVSRNVGGTDDMTENARLFGVWIQYKANASVAAW
ncbi:MAG: hypothetical protein WC332_01455 [Clostridia bacterium]|jgi:hypothetical protein